MILSRVTGVVWATRQNEQLEGKKILITQPLDLEGNLTGSSLLALDRVDAGEGDQVLVNKEGSGARLLYGSNEIPVQAVVVAVIDRIHVAGSEPDL
jgi:ethanolamine utilization protein EutN